MDTICAGLRHARLPRGATCAEREASMSGADLAGVGDSIVLGNLEAELPGSSHGEIKGKTSAVRGRRP